MPLASWAEPSEGHGRKPVSDALVQGQRAALLQAASAAHSGPQSPRDLSKARGANPIVFSAAPNRAFMNLCNIHFHESAEHRGGDYTTYAGNGDGDGHGSGYRYNGVLTAAELKPVSEKVGRTEHGELLLGSTIEIHFVHSTAPVKPGPTLASCLSKENGNPQLRVEAVVAVLVNDRKAADFVRMADLGVVMGYQAAPTIPENLGKPVVYSGSTTGPKYNSIPSPLQVTWSVRPKVVKVDILSVAKWLKANPFQEDHAHGVRNLVDDPALLSPISAAR
ncbi:MAG: delta-class carbonic anhydrase [Cyanobacteriota bacterium]